MLKGTLSRLHAVALRIHLTLQLLLFEQSMRVLIAIEIKYLILIKGSLYSIEDEDNNVLHLCFVFKNRIVCKDDVFLALQLQNMKVTMISF